MKKIIYLLSFFILSALFVIFLLKEDDPWDDFYPYWGARPGELSQSLYCERYGSVFPVHILIDAEDWVAEKMADARYGRYIEVEPDDVDVALVTLYKPLTYKVWRRLYSVDMGKSPLYQSSNSTFIIFDDGVCIFYMYNAYLMNSTDVIPPHAPAMEPLSDNVNTMK